MFYLENIIFNKLKLNSNISSPFVYLQDVTCKSGEICMPGKESCEKSPCPIVGKCYGL